MLIKEERKLVVSDVSANCHQMLGPLFKLTTGSGCKETGNEVIQCQEWEMEQTGIVVTFPSLLISFVKV